MNKKIIKAISLVTILAIVILLSFSFVASFNIVSAKTDDGLIITKSSAENVDITTIENIQNFSRSKQQAKIKTKNIAKEVYSSAGLDLNKIEKMSSKEIKEIINCKKITIFGFNKLEAYETYTTRAGNNLVDGEEYEEEDLEGNGYVSATITVYESVNYDINATYNKDTKEWSAEYYGYKVDYNLTWEIRPVYRMKDMFFIGWDSDVKSYRFENDDNFYAIAGDLTPSAYYAHYCHYVDGDIVIENGNVSTSVEDNTAQHNFSDARYTHTFCPCNFGLNHNVGGTIYLHGSNKNVRPDNFQLNAGLAHKQLVITSGVSLSGSGLNIGLDGSFGKKLYKTNTVTFHPSES